SDGITAHVSNPDVGDTTQTDPSLLPFFPALFITDITLDPASTAGDWQNGGTPVAPNDVFGTWKAATASGTTITLDPEPAPNLANLGPGSDVPSPGASFSEGYGAEVRWNASSFPGGLT